ncbi:MAG: GNAT family N-acetyltransferase [Nocardioides sp.]
MEVREADTAWELEQVRRLFRAFVSWHRERHTGDLDLIDAYFDEGAWQAELDGLPGAYAPPDGALLVCWEAELAIGCVAFRRLDAESCEMKRMFVVPMARGRGAGRALAEAVVAQARAAGYRSMYLDTSVRQAEAIALYRDLGFVEVEAFHDVPDEMADWLVFFRLDL